MSPDEAERPVPDNHATYQHQPTFALSLRPMSSADSGAKRSSRSRSASCAEFEFAQEKHPRCCTLNDNAGATARCRNDVGGLGMEFNYSDAHCSKSRSRD